MKKIIYVEDNPDTAEAVRMLLSRAGFEVDVALNGKEGLEKTLASSHDMVLLDVMLPDMSGWDIYARVKDKIDAKFVFLSAIPISGERMAQLKKEGVSDYITKPFEKEDLIYRINFILEKK